MAAGRTAAPAAVAGRQQGRGRAGEEGCVAGPGPAPGPVAAASGRKRHRSLAPGLQARDAASAPAGEPGVLVFQHSGLQHQTRPRDRDAYLVPLVVSSSTLSTLTWSFSIPGCSTRHGPGMRRDAYVRLPSCRGRPQAWSRRWRTATGWAWASPWPCRRPRASGAKGFSLEAKKAKELNLEAKDSMWKHEARNLPCATWQAKCGRRTRGLLPGVAPPG